MRFSARTIACLCILPLVSAIGFASLIASPSSLIVDGSRASLDYADRGQTRGIGNDLTSVFLPRFRYIVREIERNGVRPDWDATGFGGRPLVGNPQAGLFYPPVWLAWRMKLPGSLGWLTVAHLLWAGLGVFVLARELGLGTWAATVAGACYQASPYLMAHTFEGHYPHVWAACWYPWAFWAFRLACRRNAAGFWLLPGFLALAFLTGHPQEWYYLVVSLALWVVCIAGVTISQGKWRRGVVQILVAMGLLGFSLGLSASELLPEVYVKPWLLRTSTISLSSVHRYQLHLSNLCQLFDPFALGRPHDYVGQDNYWETLLSVGLTPMMLATIGIFSRSQAAITRPWSIVMIVAVLFAAGRKLGIYSIAYATLPGMERFRVPSRTLFLATLAASILAGAGVEALRNRSLSQEAWQTFFARLRLALFGLVVISIGFFAWRIEPEPGTRNGKDRSISQLCSSASNLGAEAGIFAMVVAGLFGLHLGLRNHRDGQFHAGVGLGIIAILEVAFYAQALLTCSPAGPFLRSPRFPDRLKPSTTVNSGESRVAAVGQLLSDLEAVEAGWDKTNINDGFQIQHVAVVYESLYPILDPIAGRRRAPGPMDLAVARFHGNLAQAVFDRMSARYLVSDRMVSLPSFDQSAANLWINRAAMPYACMVPRAFPDQVAGYDSMGRRLAAMDPREGVFLNRDPLPKASIESRQAFKPAVLSIKTPDLIAIKVTTNAPGYLVISQTWMPGWFATIDKNPTEILRGNLWQQVLAIDSAGHHEITMRYVAPGLAMGKRIAQCALLLWLGVGVALGMGSWKARSARRVTPSRDVSAKTIRA